MQNNNQNTENTPERMDDQGKPQQDTGKNDQQDTTFDNPQQGKSWDNYQTRTLSAEEGEGAKITQEEVEEAIRSSEQNKA